MTIITALVKPQTLNAVKMALRKIVAIGRITYSESYVISVNSTGTIPDAMMTEITVVVTDDLAEQTAQAIREAAATASPDNGGFICIVTTPPDHIIDIATGKRGPDAL